ncbi:MAG: EF-hand domain-containing protein, partial [Planctomycetaceae bacterium]|nr:EF-hand domain-containing protein [Planctomycetaceae bacterium]
TVPQLATPADQVVPLTVVDPRQIGSITPSHVGIPYKVVQYASRILEKYDINGNGFLEREEWSKMPGAPQSIDTDGDFIISLDEMIRFIVLYGSIRTIHRPNPPLPFVSSNWDPATMSPFKPFSAPPKPKQEPNEPKTEPTAEIDENQIVGAVDSEPAEESGNEKEQEKLEELFYETVFAGQFNPAQRKYHVPLSELRGVPNWFVLRDKNGDGQLSMLEFDPTLSPKGLAEFARLDKNGDGFLTPDEVRVEQK